MLKDALDHYTQLARQSAAPQTIDLADPRKKHVVIDAVPVALDVPPPLRSHTVDTLDDLIQYAHRAAAAAKSEGSVVVWHNPQRVTLLCDDADRRDTVSLILDTSRQWDFIAARENEYLWRDQRTFIRELRSELGMEPPAITLFRRLTWSAGVRDDSDISTTRDRMGRAVDAAVTGTEDLPEELQLDLPIYDTPGERAVYTVRVLLEIDHQAQRLALRPAPGELRARLHVHQEDLRARLEEGLPDTVPAFYGQP